MDKGIIIKYSANYYPQGNDVAESTNKNLVRILKKMVIDNQINRHNQIHNAPWADRVTPKEVVGNSSYFLSLWTIIHPPKRSLSTISSIGPRFQRGTIVDHATKNQHSSHARIREGKG
jgi:hypothetical protein